MGLGKIAQWAIAIVVAATAIGAVALLWSSGGDMQILTGRLNRVWREYAERIDLVYSSVERLGRLIAPIATIAGVIYGIYHKWQFSKSRMHVHIAEFLKRDDKRLMPVREKLSAIFGRIGPAKNFDAPIFAASSLDATLRKMKWGRREKADISLAAELEALLQQTAQWGNLKSNYDRRQAQVHLLQGAIAATRASEARTASADSRGFDNEALEHFKKAYELDTSDAEALEYLAHQRIRLGDNTTALADFEQLQKLAKQKPDALAEARAMKFQAAVRESEGIKRLALNPSQRRNLEPNLQIARDLLRDALRLLPESARGGLEEAEITEMRGRVHKTREVLRDATTDYRAAFNIYQRIKTQSSENDPNGPATMGLKRCEAAILEIQTRPLQSATTDNDGSNGQDITTSLERLQLPIPQPATTDLTTKPTE